MTPLHNQIFQTLLPVCLETTTKMRENYSPVKIAEDGEEAKEKLKIVARLKPLYSSLKQEHGLEFSNKIFNLLAVATDNDKIKIILEEDNNSTIYDPFTIIVMKADNVGHKQPLNIPYICIHGANRIFLGDNNKYNFEQKDVVLASDEEVESCIANLNPWQLRYIMYNDLFAPIVNGLFEQQDELVVDKNEDKK